MAAPTFLDATNGATDAGGVWSYTIVSALPGNVQVVQILQDGTTNGAVTFTGATNIEDLAGTDNAWTQITGPNADGSFPVGSPEAARQFLFIGRCINTNAPTISGGNSTSEDLYIRAYRFTDVSTGTTLATVIENGTAGATDDAAGTSTTGFFKPTTSEFSVTSLDVDRLALVFLAVNDDNPVDTNIILDASPFTTQFSQVTAEYAEASGTDGCIALYQKSLPTATTVPTGTVSCSITDPDAWGLVGFALIGTTVEGPVTYVPRHPAHDFGSVTNF